MELLLRIVPGKAAGNIIRVLVIPNIKFHVKLLLLALNDLQDRIYPDLFEPESTDCESRFDDCRHAVRPEVRGPVVSMMLPRCKPFCNKG